MTDEATARALVEMAQKGVEDLEQNIREPWRLWLAGLSEQWRTRMVEARRFLEAAHPTSGRGVGYHLVSERLLGSTADIPRMYSRLVQARMLGFIPWEWIVDETRGLERVPCWSNLPAFLGDVRRAYRRDPWDTQPHRVEVWSEKGTVRGVLAPVLDQYAVGFRVLHGFAGHTMLHDVATESDRPLRLLYVGDWDPSGLCMSEDDLPRRLQEHGAKHVRLTRVALVEKDLAGLPPGLPIKNTDSRAEGFRTRYGDEGWELDALDPRTLRTRVERHIKKLIRWPEWKSVEQSEARERRRLAKLTK